MKNSRFRSLLQMGTVALLFVPAMAIPVAAARRSKKHDVPADRINVIGHLALANASITNLKSSEHWQKTFLELQDPTHGTLTVVDITDPTHPVIAKQLRLPSGAENESLSVLVGDAGLLTVTQTSPTATHPTSVSVVNFADSARPKIVRTFNNVTAYQIDEGRGLIYLVNNDGLWILQKDPAPDTKLEESYAKYIVYNH